MEKEISSAQPFLQKLAMNYTNNVADAQDLVQETMLKAISKYHLFTPGTSFKNWTATIMRNAFINEYRRKKKWRLVELDNIPTVNVATRNLGETILAETELDKIKTKLKEDQREILSLIGKGYKYEEIAQMLNIPLGTVKSKVHFARKAVKKEYNKLNTEINFNRA